MEEPWLRACKRLPIGGTARFRCCGRTPAAVLYNNPDSWQMWCHRCKQTAYERKEFVTLAAPVQQRDMPAVPDDAVLLQEAPAETQSHVYSFLVGKGIMPDMIPENTKWSQEQKRLLFPAGESTWLGRATTNWVQPKWLTYGPAVQYAIAQPASPQNATEVVLTEDYLSALKLAYVSSKFFQSRALPIALLGTRLSPRLKAGLVDMKLPVLVMLDGDTAGYSGTETVRKHLKPFLPLREFSVPGKDPKDLQCNQILEVFNE